MNDRLKKIWNKMTIPNKVNLFFVVVMVLLLLFWSFTLLSSMEKINKINAHQLEDCYYLDCNVSIFGMSCEKTKFKGGGDPFNPINKTKKSLGFNITR